MSIFSLVGRNPAYGIGELAELGGVSRRTVRYYIQQGLLPAPHGLGRGRHYGSEHLERLLRVRALQERGLSLDAVRSALAGGPPLATASHERHAVGGLPVREPWVRVRLPHGAELHVPSGVRLPPPGRMAELEEWCRIHLRAEADDE